MAVAPERTATDPVEIARGLAERFREGAVERDRDRRFPHEEVGWLKQSGLPALLLPKEVGGMGGGSRELVHVIAALAEGDSSIAQMYLIHTYGVALIMGVECDEEVRQRYYRRMVEDGMFITNAFSEASGKTVVDYSVKMRKAEDGDWRITGTKSYCTGSLGGDIMYVLGQVDGAPELTFKMGLIECDAPGVTIKDDWTGMGQRTTASGTTVFEDVVIPDEVCFDIAMFATPEAIFGSLGQCMFTALHIGMARDAMRDALEYVRTKSRPWPHSGVEKATDDPYVIATIGEMQIMISASEAMLERAIDVREIAEANTTAATRDAASVAASEAKVVSSRAVLKVAELLFQVCGTGSVVSKYDHDRHWRNARTLTLHDPEAYKVRLVGDWVLNHLSPPISVYT